MPKKGEYETPPTFTYWCTLFLEEHGYRVWSRDRDLAEPDPIWADA